MYKKNIDGYALKNFSNLFIKVDMDSSLILILQ
jgi:hypothetical protein